MVPPHIALFSWKDSVPTPRVKGHTHTRPGPCTATHHEGVGGDPSGLAQWPLPQLGRSLVSEGRAWQEEQKLS